MGFGYQLYKKMMVLTFLVGGSAIASKLSAQTIETDAIPKAFNAQESLILQEQSRLNFEEAKRNAARKKSAPIPYEKPTTPSVIEGELPSFLIHHIQLEGITLLPKSTQKKLISGYIDRKLTLNDINQLSASITNAYLLLGYVTSRTYLPKQNLKEGQLVLHIQEGFIEDIQVQGITPWQSSLAFLGKNTTPLNIWDLEESLDQINRLSSLQATLQLLPSPLVTGGSRIQVQTTAARSGSASFRYDTYSDPQVQAIPNSLDLNSENILSSLDQWNFNYYQKFKDKTQFQNSVSVSGTLPVGALTPKISYSQFNYATLVSGTLRNILTSGQTSTFKVGGTLLTYRDSKQKETLTLELTTKSDQNYIEDTLVGVNSSQLTTLSAGFNHTQYNTWGTLTWEGKYTRGIGKLGATQDSTTLNATSPHAQFQKVNGDLNLSIPVQNFFNYTLQAHVNGQYSDQTLYSSERMSVGDFYSVPGYDTSFSGDLGATGYLKAAYTPDLLNRSLTITPALNGGFTWKKGLWNESGGKAYMTSLSTTFTYRDNEWTTEFTAARGLYASSDISKPRIKLYLAVTRSF